jgi:8-oxo-dGTP diphosphatase
MRCIVNGLLVRKGFVLLAKRSPHRAAYPRLWSFPGGHVEESETLTEALVRELREEIGVTPTKYTCIGVITDPNAPACDPIAYHMYCITAWEGGKPTILGDEHSELAWIPLAAAASIADLALPDYRGLLTKLSALA